MAQPPPPTSFDDKKEVVAQFRELVKSEETRSNNFNVRAAAVLSATAIVTAITGFYAKDLYTQAYKSFSDTTEGLVTAGLLGTLLALAATVSFCLRVLLPKTRYAFSDPHVKKWAGAEAQVTSTGDEQAPTGALPTIDEIYRREIHELGWIFLQFLSINNTKANRLENAYKALGAAIGLAILVAGFLGLYAAANDPITP